MDEEEREELKKKDQGPVVMLKLWMDGLDKKDARTCKWRKKLRKNGKNEGMDGISEME